MPIHYGPSINLENAKKAVALALAEARKNNWTMAAAIVDNAGNLVYFEKMDNTQIGSVNVAIEKARSAAFFKRSTKALVDVLASGAGGLRVLGVHGAVPVEGGIPLLIDGNIVGAIGISGETSQQDGQCAKGSHGRLKNSGSQRRSAVPARLPDFCGTDESEAGRFDSSWRLDLRNQV